MGISIVKHIDYTLLKPTATREQIDALCLSALKYKAASVCIPPSLIAYARNSFGRELNICTVIGFPCGYSTTATKVFETDDAVRQGANEIDMVINLGDVKEKHYNNIRHQVDAIRAACRGKILKVIVETCYLDYNEKLKLLELVHHSEADFIKTSTGFGTGIEYPGATYKDIELFASKTTKKIKASGGIKSKEQALGFLSRGADRIGTSTPLEEFLTEEEIKEYGEE